MQRFLFRLLPGLALLLPAWGAEAPAAKPAALLKLTSPAFAPGADLPARCTRDGANVAPPLAWTAPPAGTASFVLIVEDPDAPDPAAPRMTWVHWVVYNLPADLRAIPEDWRPPDRPGQAREGMTDRKNTGYDGPAPPIGKHRYFFRLYALDIRLPDQAAPPTKTQLFKLMHGHVLAQAELIGRYQRGGR